MAESDLPHEPAIHSFIVKIFVDPALGDSRRWHGYVTHIPGGERRYLTSLKQISIFIAPFLNGSGTRHVPFRSVISALRRHIRPTNR